MSIKIMLIDLEFYSFQLIIHFLRKLKIDKQ